LTTLMALIMIPASATTNLTGEYQFSATTDPLSILAINSNTTAGSGGIQANSYAGGGKGMFGYSDAPGSAAPGFGVAGISQNGYGLYGSSYGTGVTAIYGENLSGSGIGIQGSSSGGNGVVGLGAQNGLQGSTSNTTATPYAGVYGADTSTSTSFVNYGVYGSTVNNFGVFGDASGTNGTGLVGEGDGEDSLGVFGVGTGQFADGVGGFGYIGVYGSGLIGGQFGGNYGAPGIPALQVYDNAAGGGTDLFATYTNVGANSPNPLSFLVQGTSANTNNPAGSSDVQVSGDIYIGGQIYFDCVNGDAFPATPSGCYDLTGSDAQPTSAGVKVQTYAAEQSMKSVEDFGEAQLVNGQGYVPLDRTYASSIAHDRSYLVFVTPEGDSHGLYVTEKTLSGFTVRESQSGRSTLAFQYRIVAHPYGSAAVRMAAIAPRSRASIARYHLKTSAHMLAMVKSHPRKAKLGSRVTRPPHNWVPNLYRR
jgi:hypothetical protein